MGKIITLGEIMLRLSPNGNDRFIQTDVFRIIPGGGEANVAISCANYGHECYFISHFDCMDGNLNNRVDYRECNFRSGIECMEYDFDYRIDGGKYNLDDD